jgi:HPt (histidine-containing phosphotransfer) domain-containing protein
VNKNNTLIQLDEGLLDDYVQSLGVEVINKMLALYRQQVAIYLIDIEKSLQSNNMKLWQEHCHKMKGAAGSVGLKSVHAKLVLMEKTTADIADKSQQLTDLKDHNQIALAHFTAWLEKYN